MRGTLGAVVRTVLVIGGFAMLLGGIVTLAYPPALSGLAGGDDAGTASARGAGPQATGLGPSLLVSLGGIVWGMTIVAAGLAMPGRSPYRLIAEQQFTGRQRAFTLLGAFLVVGLPLVVWSAAQTGLRSSTAILGSGLLSIVGALLVLFGTAGGLKYQPRKRQNS
ncbi:hypothetical protein ACFR9U_08575 [Halorientalis brevis]|uniref:Uncharacterized protein n=1 Tax=Halorientalis brevis TaxID=1126241 RepID=A0ABD6CCT2_9EURY|nr:hypothetical protein [Halorientalis brevis]